MTGIQLRGIVSAKVAKKWGEKANHSEGAVPNHCRHGHMGKEVEGEMCRLSLQQCSSSLQHKLRSQQK